MKTYLVIKMVELRVDYVKVGLQIELV